MTSSNTAYIFSSTILCLLFSFDTASTAEADPRDWTFAIDVHTPGLEAGTLTYLGYDDGKAFFVTCFHVMKNAESFAISLPKLDGIGVTIASHEDAEVLADPAHDLVLIAVPLERFGKHGKGLLPATGALEAVLKNEDNAIGVAIGYSFLGRSYRLISPVEIWGGDIGMNLRTADNQVLMPRQEKDRPVSFRYLHRINTVAGMSGGPVIAENPLRFAGIVCARLNDTQGLSIAASSIQKIYERRKEVGKFVKVEFAREIAFDVQAKVAFHNAKFVDLDKKSWESFEEWGLLLDTGDGPRQFLGSFQEIRRDLAAYTKKPVGEPFKIDFKAGKNCEVWINGVPAKSPPGVEWGELTLQPGENLIAARKSQARKGWSLNDLLAANELSLDLKNENGVFLSVSRSLPAVVENYVVFVTLTNGAPKRHFPVKVDPTWVEPKLRELPPAIKVLTENLQTNWCIDLSEQRTKSRASGTVRLDPAEPIQWRPISTQTVDLELPLRIKVNELRARLFGIDAALPRAVKEEAKKNDKVEEHQKDEELQITVWLRFQLLSDETGKPRLSARALAGWMKTPLTIPLLATADQDAALGVDLRAVFAQLFVSYLNRDHFRPDGAGNFDLQSVALKAIGEDIADESRVAAAMLGLREVVEVKRPQLALQKLSVTGKNRHFAIQGEGELKVEALQIDKYLVRDPRLTFRLELDSDKTPGQLGVITAKFVSGTLEYTNKANKKFPVTLRPTDVRVEIAIDGKIKLNKAPSDLYQELLPFQ